MKTSYNRIAGQSVERLAALSDGIFAVAMTPLLLEIHVPAKELIRSEGDLRHALAALASQLLVYLMSFLTLGIFWVGQQTQLNHLERCERHLTWIHLAFFFGDDHAVFRAAPDRVHGAAHCAGRLLDKHISSRCLTVCQLGPRDACAAGEE